MSNSNYKTGSANIILSDFPDPDVIRVNDTFYMISTTMHFMPGAVILKSYNLLDWEFCTYVYDNLDKTEGQTLQDNKGIYGRGMWAATLKYHNGLFYVAFVCNDTHKTYLYTAEDIQKPWKKSEIQGFYHDMSLLFEDDIPYVVYGNTQIHLTQLKKDLSGPEPDGINKIILEDNKDEIILGYEGSHFYKINGKYYLFFIHMKKGQPRTEACFVSDKIDGPYTGKEVLNTDFGNWQSGVAQGAIVQNTDGQWYSILFQDHGALGRIPLLMQIDFSKEFPCFVSEPENPLCKIKTEVSVFDNCPDYKYTPLYGSAFTDKENHLLPYWQFNHTPDDSLYKLENNSYTITTGKTVINLTQAANTLTQRTFGHNCSATVTVDATNLNNGDFAGFCALEGEYAFIALTKEDNHIKLICARHQIRHNPYQMNCPDSEKPEILCKVDFPSSLATLKLSFSFAPQNDKVSLEYLDPQCKTYKQLCSPVPLRYTLDQFVGVRFAVFTYSTIECGGSAIFSDFNLNKPQ